MTTAELQRFMDAHDEFVGLQAKLEEVKGLNADLIKQLEDIKAEGLEEQIKQLKEDLDKCGDLTLPPTPAPTPPPTQAPTTQAPTMSPTQAPTMSPTQAPTQ